MTILQVITPAGLTGRQLLQTVAGSAMAVGVLGSHAARADAALPLQLKAASARALVRAASAKERVAGSEVPDGCPTRPERH